MDNRLIFKKGLIRNFIEEVKIKLNLDNERLGQRIGFSARTIRDWERDKFRPSEKAILKLGKLSEIEIPKYKLISWKDHMKKAAKLGGEKRYELYGAPGTIKDRSKGGLASWTKRKNDPELWKVYTKPIQEPKESVELAEFIGIMLGDGGLTHFQCSVYLHSEIDWEYASFVKDLFNKLFNVKPKIYVHKKHKVCRVSVSSVNLVKYLVHKGLSLGNKVSLQVGVPDWVLLKEEYIRACIRGLIDTDGSLVIHRYKIKGKMYAYPKISFSNRSEPLLEFVYQGLKQLGFNAKRSYKSEVWLHSQKEVKRYLEVIGVSNYKPNINTIGWVVRVV